MEEVCIRFPHIMEQINEDLEFDTLVKLRESNRIVCNVIDNQIQGRFFWIRRIPTTLPLSNCIEFKEDWKNVFTTTEMEHLKMIAIHIQTFFTSKPARRNKNWSPMHIASAQGNFELCKKIAEVTEDRNPKLKDNWTPLHFAAQSGHLEICKFLCENLQDKNPGTKTGITPLHLAAQNGQLKIYKFICETVTDKNPTMDKEITPLHLAAKHDHIEVCKFICENVQNVSPEIRANFGPYKDSLTPMTFAINRANVKVANTIEKYAQEKFSDHASKFLVFTILGSYLFLVLSFFIFQIFGYAQLLLGFIRCPFAWPYLTYGRFLLLYCRDMSLTNYIHQTFDR